APIEPRSRIFKRLETSRRTLPEFPLATGDHRFLPRATPPSEPRMESVLARRAELIAERYAPAYVVVDAASDVLHFSGRTGRYLDPAGGAASLNLLSLVKADLRLGLRSALARAAKQNEPVQVSDVSMQLNGHSASVEIVV